MLNAQEVRQVKITERNQRRLERRKAKKERIVRKWIRSVESDILAARQDGKNHCTYHGPYEPYRSKVIAALKDAGYRLELHSRDCGNAGYWSWTTIHW